MLSIADELTAFCFNAAATVRKMEWENKRDLLRLQETKFMTRQAISEAFGGEVAPPISFEDDKSGEIDPSSPDVW